MSAVVCGKRSSSIFEEHLHTPPPASKRSRCAASSPTAAGLRLSPSRASPSSPSSDRSGGNLAHLRSLFPEMDHQVGVGVSSPECDLPYDLRKVQTDQRKVLPFFSLTFLFRKMFKYESQFLERTLEASGDDLDSAIKSLHELRLGSAEINLVSGECRTENGMPTNVQIATEGRAGVVDTDGVDVAAENPPALDNLPTDGSEWVELLVREMMNASDMDDARARASRVLEVLEKSIVTHASAEAIQSFQKENMMLKEQMEALLRENNVLKRAVAIQHERQKEFDERGQELQHLKQLVSQYQEQVRNLEINNYALTMHLRQAQQGSSIPGRFHPDVF